MRFDLCLVCFQEFIFLETIFPTFPCLAHIRKISQRNLNSGQRKIIHFMPGKCFPFLILRKTLSFPLFTKHVPSSSDYRDWRNWWIKRTELRKKRILLLHHSREEEEEVWFRHRHRHHILRDQLITQQEICDLGTSISIPAVNMIKKRVSLCVAGQSLFFYKLGFFLD